MNTTSRSRESKLRRFLGVPRRWHLQVLALVLLLVLPVAVGQCKPQPGTAHVLGPGLPHYRNTAPGVKKGTAEATLAARDDLARVIKLRSTEPSDYEVYADTLAQTGDIEGAIGVLKRGIAMDPYYSRFYKNLAMRYIAAKRYADAFRTIGQELDLFPEDGFMRKLYSMIETSGQSP